MRNLEGETKCGARAKAPHLCLLLVGMLLLAGCASAPDAQSLEATQPSVDAYLLLDTRALASPPQPYPAHFDIARNGAIVVQTTGNLYDVAPQAFLLSKDKPDLATFAMAGDRVLTLVGGKLRLREEGKWVDLLEVPLGDVKLAADAKSIYICGTPPDKDPTIFLYVRGKGYQALLTLPQPMGAMCLCAERLHFTVGPGIFSLKPGEKLRQEAILPAFSQISSLAVDEANGIIYLSDGKALFALVRASGKFILILPDVGGEIKFHEKSLYLLTQQMHALFRFDGLSDALTTEGPWLIDWGQKKESKEEKK